MRRIVEILIVDDSDEDAALTLDVLRTVAPGKTVLRLTDGEQALHFICGTHGYLGRPAGLPQLVLLDLHMPGMDGMDVVRALRARPETQDLPLVLWTSTGNPLFVDQALQAGASAYHTKPQNLDDYRVELEGIVQRWLHDGATESATSTSKRSA